MRGMKKGVWVIGGASFVVMMIGAALTMPVVKAENNSSIDGVNISIPVACTMVGTVTSAHTTSTIGGTQVSDIGTTKINTVCNDKNGYLVYAKGMTQNASNEVVLSAVVGSNYDIKTGTGTSADGRSSWGMKLAQITGDNEYPPEIVSGYNAYTAVPNTWTKVAYKESATSSIASSQFTTTYNVYTTIDQPAGNYSGQVQYVMLHPSNTTVLPTTTLESAFAAAGKQKVAVSDPVTGQTGNFYRMQDMENAICNAATYTDDNNSIQLVDARDSKLYWVTKLQDGPCWMTQNIDLDLTSGVALTSELTDLNDNSLNGAYGVGYSYDADSKVISWKPTNTTRDYQHSTGTGWSNNNNVAYSLDPGEWYWDGDDSTANCGGYFTAAACKDHFTGFTSSDPASARDNVNKHLSVGNYYNWSAAIASDGSGSLTTSTYNNINLNPQNSICPKGWRLPTVSNMSYGTVNSTSEFGRLNQLYNGGGSTDPKLISAPLWFVRSCFIVSDSFNNSGSSAYYWSSTVSNSSNAYNLDFSATGVNPAGNDNRHNGRSVRCVARWY